MNTSLSSPLHTLQSDITRYALDAGRKPQDIHLIAVSKTVAAERIIPFLEEGHCLFGENYVQEAQGKWPALKETYPDTQLHLIGPLQSNKVKAALGVFDVIHSLDRPSLAKALAKEIEASGKSPRLFIQVNTGEEPQKGGVSPMQADEFIKACRSDYGLTIKGLMCVPPFDEPPSPHFALLSQIARRNGLNELSMGMSGDYPQAIRLGATYIRVGTALFGAR